MKEFFTFDNVGLSFAVLLVLTVAMTLSLELQKKIEQDKMEKEVRVWMERLEKPL
jgi:hypothetical protein